MFVLIWATLLFSVRGSNADSGAPVERCQNGFCITLNDGEITAEAGLCVVIPCSFTTPSYFTPLYMVWYKCEPYKYTCSDSETIFHSNKNKKKVVSRFKGRVSLLEPDIRLKNCSIIINDLTESDSGSYQFRVNGMDWNRRQDGFSFSPRVTVSVKGLNQKPTVMIPPLIEGQQTTLNCTAPGLCSGSDPEITWTWRRTGENDSHIAGNITDFETESLTAVTQRHSSTLTFNLSAEHHGTEVTCKVSFANNIITEETVTLNVTYMKEVEISGKTSVKEGETLNLSCSVESFPPSLIMWTKFSDKNMQNETETNLQNNTSTDLQNHTETSLQNHTETNLQEESRMGMFSISNMTAKDSGRYICTAKHLNNTVITEVDVTVIYMREPVITGNAAVEEGDTLNLTCSVDSFPPSHITWTILGSSAINEHHTDLPSSTGSSTFLIHEAKTEHSGRYICAAQHLNRIVTTFADVAVTLFPKILNSGCKVKSALLTCECISEGFPLPTIKWPLLKNHTEYSVLTTVSNHTVNSTVSLTLTAQSSTAVECVSSNENGEAKGNLTTRIDVSKPEDQMLKMFSREGVIIAFFMGVLLSAVLCCLVTQCRRTKQKSSGNLDQTLEMVTSQEDPLIDAGHAVEDNQTFYQDAAEGGAAAVATEKAALNHDAGPKDMEYASIDFSKLKRKSPREAAKKQESTETEYAEIKREVKMDREVNNGVEGDILEGKEEEEMMGYDEETKRVEEEEKEDGEDVAVYSNVKDTVGEI